MEQSDPSSRDEAFRVGAAAFLLLFVLLQLPEFASLAAPGLRKLRGLYAVLLTVGGGLLLYGVVRQAGWIRDALMAFLAAQLLLDPLVHFGIMLTMRLELLGAFSKDPLLRLGAELAGGPEKLFATQRAELVLAGIVAGLAAGIPVCAGLFALLRWRPFAGAPDGETLPSAVGRVAGIVEAAAHRYGVVFSVGAALVAYPVLYAAGTWLALL